MKIIIHSLDELKELAELIAHGAYRLNARTEAPNVQTLVVEMDAMAAAQYAHDLHPAGYEASAEKAVRETSAALRAVAEPSLEADDNAAELDANGRPWDEELDSAAKTKTAKGVWTRSRRRDLTDERYNARVAELIAEQRASVDAEGTEPVATETHALPADEVEEVELTATDEMRPVTKDLTALVEASREAAGELAGDMKPLLDASKAFIGEYGTSAFNELKQAVAATEDGNGKPLQTLTPGERRLLEACIGIYAAFS